MNITGLLASYKSRSGELGDGMSSKVAIALAHVVQNYILVRSSSFVLTLGCKDICSFFNNILEQVFYMWGVALLQIVVLQKPMPRVPGSRNYNLILVDSFEVFAAMDIASYTASNTYNERYFIFLQIPDAQAHSHMTSIFNYCWSNYLINCDVLLQSSSGDVMVFTYYPFTAEKCGSVEPVLINKFNGSGFENSKMFPHKLFNMHGCPLRAALWDIPPYVSLKTNDKGISEIVGGFEGNLLRTLATKLNFTIDIKIPPYDEQHGGFLNNEWDDALGMLDKRLADLSLGCFLKTNTRDKNASSLNNHYISTQIIAVPKNAYIFTAFEVLVYPFTTGAWFCIFFVFAFSIILLNTLKVIEHRKQNSSNSLLNLLLVFVGMPISARAASSTYTRLFWATWLFCTLIIRAIYQSLLFHIIRTKTAHRLPKDIMELLAENYTIVATTFTFETLNYSPFTHFHKRVVDNVLQMMAFETILNEPSRQIVAIGPLDFLIYYMRLYKQDDAFVILKDIVVNLPITIYFTKHSYLINEFHDQVMWIRSGGLLDIWVARELSFIRQDDLVTANDASTGLKEIYVSIIIGGCVLAIATLVLVLEILSKRYKVLKQIFSQI